MTNREAIEQLQDAKDGYKEYLTKEALDVAIKTLEQTEKTEEMIYMLLNEADVEANKLKDSNIKYDIGYRDGINFIAHKLEALMKLIGKEKKE